MNHNYIIILFLAFFLAHVEKTRGCHPAGEYDSNGSMIQNATFSPGQITVTTFINNGYTQSYTDAIGHFTFDYTDYTGGLYYSGSARILHDPEFVNDHRCADRGPNAVNPYTKTWDYDSKLTPPKGALVTVKLSIYWDCNNEIASSVHCSHEDVEYKTIV